MLKGRTWLEIFGRDRDGDGDGDGGGDGDGDGENETIFTFALWSEPRC